MSPLWITLLVYMSIGAFLSGRHGHRLVKGLPLWRAFLRALASTGETRAWKRQWLRVGYALVWAQGFVFSLVFWPHMYSNQR